MDYFNWLCKTVLSDKKDIDLLSLLDSYKYEWYLYLDENREQGGLRLRRNYANIVGVSEYDVRNRDCSLLEMMIGLSELMSEQTSLEVYECFWVMVDNLGLRESKLSINDLKRIIENFLSNKYKNKKGGLFPLKYYAGDIRDLDLYSQMNAWINENIGHHNIF